MALTCASELNRFVKQVGCIGFLEPRSETVIEERFPLESVM